MYRMSNSSRRSVRLAGVMLAAALGVSGLASCSSSGSGASGDTMTLGFLATLTGAGAPQSVTLINGAKLAVEVYNKTAHKTVTLDVQDDQSDPVSGLAAYNLLASKGLNAIVGPNPSSVALAVKPVANRQHVVLMSAGASTPDYPTEGGYTFRTWIASDVLERATAEYFTKKLNIKSVAILAEDAQTFRATAAADAQVYGAAGGKVTEQEFVAATETNYLPQLTKLLATHPATVMLEFTSPASIGNAVKQARQLGFHGPIMSANNAANQTFLDTAGSAADGVCWSKPSTGNDAAYNSFVTAYKAKYGQTPDAYAASAYDDVMIMAKALAAVGNNGPALRTYLLGLKNYDGASGPITFKLNGDLVSKPIVTETVKSGQIVDVQTALAS
jgi:branched-chain amino acid transport system substrate-binding protein